MTRVKDPSLPPPAEEPAAPWAPRQPAALLNDQLAALDAWNAELLASRAASGDVPLSRELRLDAERRIAARDSERQALLSRAEEQFQSTGNNPMQTGRPRAVIAHRNAWFRNKMADRLAELDVEVIASAEDGAHAAAAVVLDQPDCC